MRFAAYAMILGAVASQDLFLQNEHRELYEVPSTSANVTTTSATAPAATAPVATAPIAPPATAPAAAAPDASADNKNKRGGKGRGKGKGRKGGRGGENKDSLNKASKGSQKISKNKSDGKTRR